MQSYGTPYPSYMYAQPLPSTASMYVTPPPMTPAVARSQGFRHDTAMLAPPPGGPFMAMPSPNGHGPPPPPHEQEQRVTGGERTLRSTHRFTNHDRSASDPTKKPLKSAMKKPARADHGDLHRSRTMPTREGDGYYSRPPELKPTASGMSRGRSMSEGKSQRPRASSLSRPRSRSHSKRNFTPGHLILSITGSNRLNLSSVIYQDTVDTIRERVLAMWPEGVIFQTYRDDTNEFHVQFSGNPWTAKSSLGLMAMKLILELFAVLARQGYLCTSVIDTASTPRLVFSAEPPDHTAEFSMMILSNGRRKIKLVNQPHQLCESLTAVLHESFPRRVRSASWDDSDMYTIEMSSLDFNRISDLMIATILEHTSRHGFKLEGTIPLTHSNFLGLIQARRELWIFRRLPSYES